MRIEHKLRNALTVADLIESLQAIEDQDAVVVFGCDYGDHGHTEQALPVTVVEELSHEESISESTYSNSGLSINSRREGDRPSEPCGFNIVVLR